MLWRHTPCPLPHPVGLDRIWGKPHLRRSGVLHLLVAVVLLIAAPGCARVEPADAEASWRQDILPTPTAAAAAASDIPVAPSPLLSATSQAEFRQRFGSAASVALQPMTAGPATAVEGNGLPYAWSTIKPLIVATLLRELGGPDGLHDEQRRQIRRALSTSDNQAAAQLYRDLAARQAGVEGAAAAMTDLLRTAGDTATFVQTQPRDSFSSYGQTLWTVSDQVGFFSALYRGCVLDQASTAYLLAEMGTVAEGQRWGLGEANSPAFKGGWGPDLDGTYLVRQVGVLTAPGGTPYAVALSLRAPQGDFASATTLLSEMAGWIQHHVQEPATPVPCRPPTR